MPSGPKMAIGIRGWHLPPASGSLMRSALARQRVPTVGSSIRSALVASRRKLVCAVGRDTAFTSIAALNFLLFTFYLVVCEWGAVSPHRRQTCKQVCIRLLSIGTLLAFTIVCISVIILRKTQPLIPRPFKTPFVPFIPILGAIVCITQMLALPAATWIRLVIWTIIGLTIYFTYGIKHSNLRK
jgi:hypothetical protein